MNMGDSKRVAERRIDRTTVWQNIPIIAHEFDIEATSNANPNSEAETFLKACKDGVLLK